MLSHRYEKILRKKNKRKVQKYIEARLEKLENRGGLLTRG
jgi:hypothetical protein